MRARQQILGTVAPRPVRPLTPFQREMLSRAGTLASPGRRAAAVRRAKRDEVESDRRHAAFIVGDEEGPEGP